MMSWASWERRLRSGEPRDSLHASRVRRFTARWVWLLAAPCLTTGFAAAQTPADPYQQGLEARRRGEWREALRFWKSARHRLNGAAKSDPRLGVAFIETCLENDDCDRLAEASELYRWSFSGSNVDAYRDDVLAEARRIVPLLSEREALEWGDPDEQGTLELSRHIRRFWIEQDPTPDTRLNERLVEHWERIVYARKKYAYNRSSPYGTDDRGLIYVKYGPPGTTTGGFLGADEMELKVRTAGDPLARERLRRLDPNPQFELWKYAELHPGEFTFFLFGNVEGTGPFELVDSPLDLVGDAARSLSSVDETPGGVRAQHYLELFYYSDLAALGGRFANRFEELARLWDSYTERSGPRSRAAPTRAELESFSYRYAEEDRYAPEGVPVAPLRSELDDRPRAADLVVQPVRLLSQGGRPVLVVQVLSSTRHEVEPGRVRPAFATTNPDLTHTLILRDEALQEAGRAARQPTAESGGISVFRLVHTRPVHMTVVARPSDASPDEADDSLPLPGRAYASVAAPLDPDPRALEVSDLAIGTAIEPGPASDALPFPLLPADRIWAGDALRVYLELYHLSLDAHGVGRFGLSFRLIPVDERERAMTTDWVTLDLELESDSETARRHFDISLAGVEPGLYRLELDARDIRSGSRRARSVIVEVSG